MPELPDLQVFSKNLDKKLKGKKVAEFNLKNKKGSKSSAAELKKAVEGETIGKVYREGKQLHIEFKNDTVLGMHLMLNGDLHLVEDKNTLKNTIFEMFLENGTGLVLTDWQGAANVQLNPEIHGSPDAMSPELNLSYLKEKLKGRSAIKNLLLDQKVIRGIGNAYADEILWEARIAPFSIANKIPDDKVKDLLHAIKQVLKNAEKQILNEHPDIIQGEIRDFLSIHNSKKKQSPTGGKILTETRGGRKTYYTEEQEVYE
jgi:formamidopyrimidine-DNA glycosylase